MITLSIDSDSVEVGEFLTGSVEWSGLGEGQLVTSLRWQTDGLATSSAYNIVREVKHDVESRAEGRLPIRWMIPHEGPLSFEGFAVSVAWTLRTELHIGFTKPEHAEMIVRVLPARVEARPVQQSIVPESITTKGELPHTGDYPNCHANLLGSDGPAECPHCGLVLAKVGAHSAIPDVPVKAARRRWSRKGALQVAGSTLLAAFVIAQIYYQMNRVTGRRTLAGWYQAEDGYDAAVALQEQTHQPMLLYFGSSSCEVCIEKLDALFDSPAAQRRLERFIKVQMNGNKIGRQRDIARSYSTVDRFAVIVAVEGSQPRFVMPDDDAEVFLSAIDPPSANGRASIAAGNAGAEGRRAAAGSPESHYVAGFALLEEGNTERAKEEFLRAVSIRPHAPSYASLASLAEQDGDWAKAAEYATQLIDIAPPSDHGRGYELRAIAYWKLGRTREARIDAARACEKGNERACTQQSDLWR